MPTPLLIEKLGSRQWSAQGCTFLYTLTGTDNDVTAKALLASGTASAYEGLIREPDPTVNAEWVDTVSGDGRWDCTVRYIPAAKKDPTPSPIGTVRIRGTTKGGTQHIQASLETVGAYGSGAATTDNGKLINATRDGVEGLDIGSGAFAFSVSKIFADTALPNLGTLADLSKPWHTNNASFTVTDTVTGLTITLAAGECLFKGADFGESRADGGVEFGYEFEAAPNETGLTIGSITGIAKGGFEYLWIRSEPADIGGMNLPGFAARAVYVERVYPAGAFSGLGL